MTRTAILALSFLFLLAPGGGRAEEGAGAESRRLVTMDWTIAETLLALGVVPQGVGEVAGYKAWVVTPPLPEGVRDIGLRSQPNLELLAEMQPDLILYSRLFRALGPVLSRVSATAYIDNAAGETAWDSMAAQTREIGRLAGRAAAAEDLIRATEARLDARRAALAYQGAPLLVVQFMDSVHVRVFGAGSLYGAVLERLGVGNAWSRPTNSWGFALVSLDRLAEIEGRLAVVEPLPASGGLPESGLWQALPSVRRGDVLRLSPAWSFGGLPSAWRFAEILSDALAPAGMAAP